MRGWQLVSWLLLINARCSSDPGGSELLCQFDATTVAAGTVATCDGRRSPGLPIYLPTYHSLSGNRERGERATQWVKVAELYALTLLFLWTICITFDKIERSAEVRGIGFLNQPNSCPIEWSS